MNLPFRLAQVALVVHDIDQARQTWASAFGLTEVPPIMTTQPGLDTNMVYKGEPSNDQAKLCFFNLENDVQIELIEPIGEKSSWAEVLRKNGEGLHHIAFWIPDGIDAAPLLEPFGCELLHRGDMGPQGEGQFIYFTPGRLGAMVELLQSKR
ncbi:MAG: VOC family protein [Fimbriimonadaceae bacterium]|jgi:catechol 2,3-dioxygenase-like lactoylglutathione lyase family enzyme|nr:VOC family protein [Fimbriimonadaceae bacterium]